MNIDRMKVFIEGMFNISCDQFNPEAILTHAALETGWFEHLPAEHNYFGQKPPSNYKGPVAACKTKEFENGKEIEIISKWVMFDTAHQALDFHASQIKRLYPKSWSGRAVPILYFEGLQDGFRRKDGTIIKWSSNPKYVEKLIAVYDGLSSKSEIMSLLYPRVVEFLEVIHGKNNG